MINKKSAGIAVIIIIALIVGIYFINADASQKLSKEKNVMNKETGINESCCHNNSENSNLTSLKSNKSGQSQDNSDKSCCK